MPIAPAINRIWFVYNHVPGGNVVASHFEDFSRRKKTGDNQETDVVFTSKDQLEQFKKSEFVALNVVGADGRSKILKGEVLVYKGGQDLSRNPKAADVVLAWATEQGVRPIEPPGKKGLPAPADVEALEARINTRLDQKLDAKFEEIKNLLKGPKGA